LLIIGLFILLLIPLLMRAQSPPAVPTPTPFTISDAEIKKIGKDQIQATLKHVLQLYRDALAIIERQKENLADATKSQTGALDATAKSLSTLTDLQEQIGKLAKHDKEVTDKLNAASKKLWWYRLRFWGAWIVFGLGVIACIVLAFLKVTGRLAILGSQVAAKIP